MVSWFEIPVNEMNGVIKFYETNLAVRLKGKKLGPMEFICLAGIKAEKG